MSNSLRTKARGIDRSPDEGRRWAWIALAAALLLLLLWIWGGSRDDAPSKSGRSAADPAWDQAYDRLLDGEPSAQDSGGIVVQGATPGRQFVQGLLVTPVQHRGDVSGYVIAAASDAAVLAQAKLRPGDVLIDVEGRPLDAERMRTLADELAPADAVEVTFERQGQIRKRLIDLTRQ